MPDKLTLTQGEKMVAMAKELHRMVVDTGYVEIDPALEDALVEGTIRLEAKLDGMRGLIAGIEKLRAEYDRAGKLAEFEAIGRSVVAKHRDPSKTR